MRARGSYFAWSLWFVVVVTACVVRFSFLTDVPDTPDGVRLIRALDHFDILDFSPHFPGYPLAVFLARSLPIEGGLAWSFLSAGAGVLSCILLGVLFGRDDAKNSLIVAGACAVCPLVVTASWGVGTDMLHMPFLLAALVARREHPLLAGVLLGLGLGVRPSAFPWLAALAVGIGRKRAILGLMAGVLTWLVPTLIVVGLENYVTEGIRFTTGHFTDWGGSFVAGSSDRSVAMIDGWLLRPLAMGGPGWVGIVLALVLGVGAAMFWRHSRVVTPFMAGSAAYFAWILLAQNPAHARHALPLLLLLLATACCGLHTAMASAPVRARCGVLIVVLISGLAMSVSQGVAHQRELPKGLAVARQLALEPDFDPFLDRIYATGDGAGDLAYLRWIGPDWDAVSVKGGEEAWADARSLPILPRRLWLTGSLGEGPGAGRFSGRDLAGHTVYVSECTDEDTP